MAPNRTSELCGCFTGETDFEGQRRSWRLGDTKTLSNGPFLKETSAGQTDGHEVKSKLPTLGQTG